MWDGRLARPVNCQRLKSLSLRQRIQLSHSGIRNCKVVVIPITACNLPPCPILCSPYSPPHQQARSFCPFLFYLTPNSLPHLSWVSAKETPKPKPQAWQINGIVAALDDGYDEVKGYALRKLVYDYDLGNLKSVVEKPEDIAQKAANILKDEIS